LRAARARCLRRIRGPFLRRRQFRHWRSKASGDDGLQLRFRRHFDRHDAHEGALGSFLVDDGDITTVSLRYGPQWNFEGFEGRFYVNAALGYYWTYANTSMFATVPGYICDPFWGYCYTVAVPGEYILNDRSENDFGLSATLGYEWDVVGGSWFVELQYHLADHGEGYEFMPLVIGMRW
jgi:hypothetical protein